MLLHERRHVPAKGPTHWSLVRITTRSRRIEMLGKIGGFHKLDFCPRFFYLDESKMMMIFSRYSSTVRTCTARVVFILELPNDQHPYYEIVQKLQITKKQSSFDQDGFLKHPSYYFVGFFIDIIGLNF